MDIDNHKKELATKVDWPTRVIFYEYATIIIRKYAKKLQALLIRLHEQPKNDDPTLESTCRKYLDEFANMVVSIISMRNTLSIKVAHTLTNESSPFLTVQNLSNEYKALYDDKINLLESRQDLLNRLIVLAVEPQYYMIAEDLLKLIANLSNFIDLIID